MTGCRHGAKNTLVTNYLYLAESNGAEIHPLTTVTDVRPRKSGGYEVRAARTGRWLRRSDRTFTADEVVFAAGTYNTQKLLHTLRESSLPNISGAARLSDADELRGAARGPDDEARAGLHARRRHHLIVAP